MVIQDADAPGEPRGKGRRCLAALLTVICLTGSIGCTRSMVEPEHLSLTPQTMAKRQLQTRVFDTDDEARVLAGIAAVLQDIGFLIDESEVELGLIVGSKERSAIQPPEVVAAVAINIAMQVLTGSSPDIGWDERQTMRVSVVTTPAGETKGTAVRVTFQRVVFTNKGGISKKEPLGSAEIYQEFYAKLSKALFLRAKGR